MWNSCVWRVVHSGTYDTQIFLLLNAFRLDPIASIKQCPPCLRVIVALTDNEQTWCRWSRLNWAQRCSLEGILRRLLSTVRIRWIRLWEWRVMNGVRVSYRSASSWRTDYREWLLSGFKPCWVRELVWSVWAMNRHSQSYFSLLLWFLLPVDWVGVWERGCSGNNVQRQISLVQLRASTSFLWRVHKDCSQIWWHSVSEWRVSIWIETSLHYGYARCSIC